jgi:hypothetical protein
MQQSSIFDLIKTKNPVANVMSGVYKSTIDTLVGKKVVINWYGSELIVTVNAKDTMYPDTAYKMSWTKQDNPGESIPNDCAGKVSIIHYSSIIRSLQ